MRYFLPGLAVALLVQVVPALADCSNLPEPAQAYLQVNPGWRVVTLNGWDSDSVNEWRKIHKDACPGLAEADLDGEGPSYALLLERRDGGKTQRKAILVQRRGGGLSTRNLAGPVNSETEMMVAHVGAGRYQDQYNRKKYRLQHDGIVLGQWGAGATLYYLSNGRVRSFTYSE